MDRTVSFERGARIWLRGDRWTVVATTRHSDCAALHVTGCGSLNAGVARTYLLPFDRPLADVRPLRPRDVRPANWWRTVHRALLMTRPFGGLDVIARTAVKLLPFQLEPAIAMLRHGHLRVLLADEVGLGKTIQSGIVLAQLMDDSPDARALIVTPAGLRRQWQGELRSRFNLRSVIADSRWLSVMATQLPRGTNPWSLPGTYITSLDFIRRPEAGRPLEDVMWDALIVDEAHNATAGTARLAAVETAAERSRRVLLLTATPPDADLRQAASLAGIGQLAADDDITVFRRTRADVGILARRKTTLIAVRLSPLERRLHRHLRRYCQRLWNEAGRRHDMRGRLTAVLLTKRALSSTAALAVSVSRRLELLEPDARPLPLQLLLPIDEDPLGDAIGDDVLAAPGFQDVEDERRQLQELCELAGHAARTGDSKLRFLARFLRRVREPAVIFTEYRDTLARLAQVFAAEDPVLLHGGLIPSERDEACSRFLRGGSLLLATDAAAEGLNLHDRCRLVLHLELPWTPARLEQRAGRVDRLGQTRRVHEVMLAARHTAERMILAPLVARLRGSAGPHERQRLLAIAESHVAARILGTPATTATDPPSSRFGHAAMFRLEAEAEAIRLMQRRKQRANPTVGSESGFVAVTSRPPSSDVTIVTSAVLDGGTGAAVARYVVALRGRVAESPAVSQGHSAVACCRRILQQHGHELRHVVVESLKQPLLGDIAAEASVRRAVERREQAIAARLRSASTAPVQAGLFDRRALDAADARARSSRTFIEESEPRAADSRAPDAAEVTVRVIGVHFGTLTKP